MMKRRPAIFVNPVSDDLFKICNQCVFYKKRLCTIDQYTRQHLLKDFCDKGYHFEYSKMKGIKCKPLFNKKILHSGGI